MKSFIICALIMFVFALQAAGYDMVIDGVLDEPVYSDITPFNGEISSLYLIPTTDNLYIGVEVEDDSINVADPASFWDMSCVEVWFDWANEDSPVFDANDQQFWFVPVEGNGDQGYAGQWHRDMDNIPATVYDYANQSDMIDAAFMVDEGVGYTIEVRIAKEAMGGYTPNGKIGFNYSADKGGAKYEWEAAMLGGEFFSKPNLWPDLDISVIWLAVQPGDALSALWGGMKAAR